jgi:hypothetical protein
MDKASIMTLSASYRHGITLNSAFYWLESWISFWTECSDGSVGPVSDILNSVPYRDLVPDSVALTDVLAPPDFILNSALGHSRYKNTIVFIWRKVRYPHLKL